MCTSCCIIHFLIYFIVEKISKISKIEEQDENHFQHRVYLNIYVSSL